MRVGEICTRSVVTCSLETSALEAAQLMRERHVGDLVVVEMQEGRAMPVGIVTDRDLVVEVMAKEVAPGMLRARDLVTTRLVTAEESELALDAVWHMRGSGIRRLPVVDAHGALTGILTADDLSRALAQALAELGGVASAQLRREQDRHGH